MDHVGMASGAPGSGGRGWAGGWWDEAAWEGEISVLVGGLREEPGCGPGENSSLLPGGRLCLTYTEGPHWDQGGRCWVLDSRGPS